MRLLFSVIHRHLNSVLHIIASDIISAVSDPQMKPLTCHKFHEYKWKHQFKQKKLRSNDMIGKHKRKISFLIMTNDSRKYESI